MREVIANAKNPDLRAAYRALSRYIDERTGALSPELIEVGAEIKRRLKRLENEANRLVRINNLLLEEDGLKVHFDESTDTVTFNFKGGAQSIKINRTHPDKPVNLAGLTSLSAYVAGKAPSDGERKDELRAVMEQMLEGLYSNAFRITKLVQVLTGRSKFECRSITMVRNKLIEHPAPGSIYSFGYSSTGPIVKPIHRGRPEWTDEGLVPNLEALSESLLEVFSRDV